eukprot:7030568-Ditylum_brightwellii.AAC.1
MEEEEDVASFVTCLHALMSASGRCTCCGHLSVLATSHSLLTTKGTPQGEIAHPPPNDERKDVSSGMGMKLKGVVGSWLPSRPLTHHDEKVA